MFSWRKKIRPVQCTYNKSSSQEIRTKSYLLPLKKCLCVPMCILGTEIRKLTQNMDIEYISLRWGHIYVYCKQQRL